jgi:hypothetical protein
MNDNIVLFSSYAKLPSGSASSVIYHIMAMVVLIDIKTGEIVEAECTLSTRTSRQFVARVLVGSSLRNGPEELVRRIEDTYYGTAQKAIITTIRGIHIKYQSYLRQREITMERSHLSEDSESRSANEG